MRDKNKSKRKKNKQPSPDQLDQWAQHVGVIIDETSMLGAPQLGHIDVNLQELRQQRGVTFGGAVVMLAGDWYQLPTVGSATLHATDGKGYAKRGQDAYRAIEDCIYLTKIMRFMDDPM